MEYLPVEVIGNILSRTGHAREVVVASATCRKWQEARRSHLHTLKFHYHNWPLYYGFSTCRLDMLITQTLFQTRGLHRLSIVLNDEYKFSAAAVIAWIMYTRDTLLELHCHVSTTPNINILEICGRKKLEALTLCHNTIMGVEPNFQKFLCLKSLSLTYVCVSTGDLGLLLTGCPRVEELTLISLDIGMPEPPQKMVLASNSLRYIYVEDMALFKFILEADELEKLHLKGCILGVFKLIGRGMLRFLKMDYVKVIDLDIGENVENVETVDVSTSTIMWEKDEFYHMVSRSSKLRKLRLWRVVFDDEDGVVDMETISSCFPNYLSLSYETAFDYILLDSAIFENVIVLELGWTVISYLFSAWVLALIERCPRLKKLVIHGVVSETEALEECHILGSFTSSLVKLMRKYLHIEVKFEYE